MRDERCTDLYYMLATSLEVIFILCPSNRIIVIDSFLGPLIHLATGSWVLEQCWLWVPFSWNGLRFYQKVIDGSHNMPLLHQWANLARAVVAFQIHSRVRLLRFIISSPTTSIAAFLSPRKLASRVQA